MDKAKAITSRLQKCVPSSDNVSLQSASELLGFGGEYETIFFLLLVEIALLRSGTEELRGGCFTSATCLGGAPPTTSVPLPVVEAARTIVLLKSVEICSVVARSTNTAGTPKDLVKSRRTGGADIGG